MASLGTAPPSLTSLLAAVRAIAARPRAFRGIIVDAGASWEEDVHEALRTTLRPFHRPQPKGFAVAWIVTPPQVMTVPPPLATTPRRDRASWQPHLTAIGRQRRTFWKEVRRTFGPPWQPYIERTSSSCYRWRQAHEAQTKGYNVWETVCRRCPLSGWPHTPPLLRPKAPRWDRPCPVLAQRNGPHGFRVLPEFTLWRDPNAPRPRPPATADLLILERWPQRSGRYWAPAELHDISQRFPALVSPPLLDILVALALQPTRLEGAALFARLATEVDLPVEFANWSTRRAQRQRLAEGLAMRRLPHNLDPLVDALRGDFEATTRVSEDVAVPRVVVGDAAIRVRSPMLEAPAIFRKMAVIDLSGQAQRMLAAAPCDGVIIATPAAVLATAQRLGPRRGSATTRWHQRQEERLARLLEACAALDARKEPKSQAALLRQAGFAPNQYALLSRAGKVTGDLRAMLAKAYGGTWQKGHGNQSILVHKSAA